MSRQIGLQLSGSDGRETIRLPCSAFEGTCSVDASRPGVCRRYECALLPRVQSGAVSGAVAARRVADVQACLAALRELLGPDHAREGIWAQVDALAAQQGLDAESAAFLRANPELVLLLAQLGAMLDRHFRLDPSAEGDQE